MHTQNNLALPALASNRRQWILGVVVTTSGLASSSAILRAADDNGLSHSAEAIHQEVVFKATTKRVYDAFTDTLQFQKIELLAGITGLDLAGKPAVISLEPGGLFSLFGGYIVGRQIELVPNQRIVQAWRVGGWQPGIYSIARFELADQGATTKLLFDHSGFPAGTGDHLASGWKSHYWEPLEKFLG